MQVELFLPCIINTQQIINYALSTIVNRCFRTCARVQCTLLPAHYCTLHPWKIETNRHRCAVEKFLNSAQPLDEMSHKKTCTAWHVTSSTSVARNFANCDECKNGHVKNNSVKYSTCVSEHVSQEIWCNMTNVNLDMFHKIFGTVGNVSQ